MILPRHCAPQEHISLALPIITVKKAFALILLLAFGVQSFSQGIVVINFYAHRAAISRNQCENRFRPMLHCNGKCILAKRLKAQEKKEQQQPELKLSAKTEVISSRSFFTTSISIPVSHRHFYPATDEHIQAGEPSTVFHPPGQ